jgi:hypothetical protein
MKCFTAAVGNTNAKTAYTRKTMRLSNDNKTVSELGKVCGKSCLINLAAFVHGEDAVVQIALKCETASARQFNPKLLTELIVVLVRDMIWVHVRSWHEMLSNPLVEDSYDTSGSCVYIFFFYVSYPDARS